MTVRQGNSAWLWKITARSRLGPSIDWLSTMTVPSDGASRPARILSTVVLPQPEWPMMQVKSPRRIDSHRSSNTVVTPPAAAGKRLVMPSIEMNLSSDTTPYSGNVTSRVARASSWSRIMPTTPITRIAVITLVIERLFHSFQTK
jgi:hypothetical protein